MAPAAVNHFSLSSWWGQGDAISHAVAWLLLAMSLASWFLIFSKAVVHLRARRASPAVEGFWAAPTADDGLAVLRAADRESIFASLPAASLALDAKVASVAAQLDREERVTRVLRLAIHRSTRKLESGVTLLASIGATAPFVGLLGTVWGIYHALSNVSGAGAIQIDKVAGPVGEALIMTGFGLVVAIPAVLAYNAFNRLNRLTLAELDGFAHDLRAWLLRQH